MPQLAKASKVISCKERGQADYLYHMHHNNVAFHSQVKIDLRDPVVSCRKEFEKYPTERTPIGTKKSGGGEFLQTQLSKYRS